MSEYADRWAVPEPRGGADDGDWFPFVPAPRVAPALERLPPPGPVSRPELASSPRGTLAPPPPPSPPPLPALPAPTVSTAAVRDAAPGRSIHARGEHALRTASRALARSVASTISALSSLVGRITVRPLADRGPAPSGA